MRLLPIALICLVACSDAATAPVGYFVETVVLTPGSVHAGDTTIVQVVLTNVTDQSRAYDPNGCVPFSALDSAGGDVTPVAFCSLELLAPVTLGPHDQMVWTWTWVTYLPAYGHSPPTVKLPAGDYSVRGVVGGSDVTVFPVTLHVTP